MGRKETEHNGRDGPDARKEDHVNAAGTLLHMVFTDLKALDGTR